ncbi:MAG TPA: phage portal protein [Kribbellaceae bacterium]|nr:phage portal protein [Kribbellaceae bacterium]
MAWWRRRRRPAQQPADLISISDPALAEYFRVGTGNYSGVAVGETTALGLSACYRAVSLISGTIAMLPMSTIREVDGIITQIRSVFDDPGGVVGMTPFEWKQTVVAHQLLHGDAFLAHVFNVGGGLAGLVPIHPSAVQVDPPPRRPAGELETPFRKTYTAFLQDGSRRGFTDRTMTHCPALSMDGRRGIGLIQVARNALGIGVAGDRAAGKMFSDGAMMSGLATPEEGESWGPDDAKAIKADLDLKTAGWENAAAIAVINRRIKLQKWQMTNEEAQFLASRQFQIEEVARFTGVPPHLLMQTEKQTSWGTGVEVQNRGLSRYTLAHWTSRLEQRLSRLLAAPRSVRFDYHEWERPTPEQEVDLLLKQTGGKAILTVNEARARLGLEPVPGGDVLELPAPAEPTPDPEAVPA